MSELESKKTTTYSYLFAEKGLFGDKSINGYRWYNDNISATGAKLLKAAKNHILELIKTNPEQVFDADTKGKIETFLADTQTRWGSTSKSIEIYRLFTTKNPAKLSEASVKLDKEKDKMDKWVASISPR